jgi:hypothetical protein
MSLTRTLALPCNSMPWLARLLLQRLNRLQYGSLRCTPRMDKACGLATGESPKPNCTA